VGFDVGAGVGVGVGTGVGVGVGAGVGAGVAVGDEAGVGVGEGLAVAALVAVGLAAALAFGLALCDGVVLGLSEPLPVVLGVGLPPVICVCATALDVSGGARTKKLISKAPNATPRSSRYVRTFRIFLPTCPNLGPEGYDADGEATTRGLANRNGNCKLRGGKLGQIRAIYMLWKDENLFMTGQPDRNPSSTLAKRNSVLRTLTPGSQTPKINASQRRLKALVAEMRAVRASGDESRLVALMQENDRLARELDALTAVRYGSG
jgi:hypothetical protein